MDSSSMSQRLGALVGLLILSVLSWGCDTTQAVVDIRQHPTQDVTIIHTLQQSISDSGNRFWHCVREDDELICDLVCGEDVQCPQRAGLIRANRSAQAQIGSASATVRKPAPERPEEEGPDSEVHPEETEQTISTQRRDEAPTADDQDDAEEQEDTGPPRRGPGRHDVDEEQPTDETSGPPRRHQDQEEDDDDDAAADDDSDEDTRAAHRRARARELAEETNEEDEEVSDDEESQNDETRERQP